MVAVLIILTDPPINAFTLIMLRIERAFEPIIEIDVPTDHVGSDHRRLRRPRFRRLLACSSSNR